MPTITRPRLEALAAAAGWPRISIYTPLHRAGREVRQDPIRLRQLADEAERGLRAGGLAAAPAAEVLAPARGLLDDPGAWAGRGDGLAVLLGDATAEVLRLPFAVPALALVGRRWHLKPLVRALDEVGPFHVLSLSRRSVRLHACDAETVRELEVATMPRDLRDVVGWDWRPDSLQHHAVAGPGRAGGTPMYHGHGEPDDTRLAETRQFLRAVDAAVVARLAGEPTALVLAGVEWLTAAYRSLTAWPSVAPGSVVGNPDELPARELHARALAVMADVAGSGTRWAEARCEELAGGPLATTDLEAVLAAAQVGRVDTLLVDLGAERWGRWDESDGTAELHDRREDGDEDLLDVAVGLVLGTGGEVHAWGARCRPPSGAAAVLRY